MTVPNRNYSSPSYRYGFGGKEKDDEIKGNSNSIAFKNRIYDSRVGRWLSLDPLQANYPNQTHYGFVSNSPIGRVDIAGLWDIEVHLDPSRKRGNEGILVLKNNKGEIVATFKAGGRGTGPNRFTKNGNTPLGKYTVNPTDGYGYKKSVSKGDYEMYGNYRLRMGGVEGEIVGKAKNRNGIAVHGAKKTNKYGSSNGVNSDGTLWNTQGCVRLSLDDADKLRELTLQLEKNDASEHGGFVTVFASKSGKTYTGYKASAQTLEEYWGVKGSNEASEATKSSNWFSSFFNTQVLLFQVAVTVAKNAYKSHDDNLNSPRVSYHIISGLNMRSSPNSSSKSNIMGQLGANSCVYPTGNTSGNWAEVENDNGETGWIYNSAKYVEK